MNTAALAAIDKEISRLENELAKLKQARAILGVTKEAPPAKRQSPPAKPTSKRAPRGEFKGAILSLFRNGDELSNADMRERLRKSGYKHPFSAMHLRKTAAKMAKAGELVPVHQGDNVRYKKPESA